MLFYANERIKSASDYDVQCLVRNDCVINNIVSEQTRMYIIMITCSCVRIILSVQHCTRQCKDVTRAHYYRKRKLLVHELNECKPAFFLPAK